MTNKPEVMNGESLDIAAHRRDELKQLFPGVFTETKDTDGNIVSSIDFERLKAELGTFSDIFEGRRERYGMDWPGKRDCMKVIQEPSRATLKPCPDESVDWDTSKNLFIEGDNLEVLKLLQKSYYGKVKMIYVDPPYNTGNEFIYPDNYQESIDTYLAFAGLVDDKGKRFSTNSPIEGRFHTNWLNMMYPRLFLSRNLLKEDGIIFISIDDNELENLRRVCNEIFGEENFLATFVWEKRTNRENRKNVSSRHDYIVCYAKSIREDQLPLNQLPMTDEAKARYKNPDNDPRGDWKSDPATAQAGHGTNSQFYDLVAPNGKVHKLQSGRCWLYTKDVMQKAIDDGRIWFGKDGNGVPRIKTYLLEKDRGLRPESILFADGCGTNESAKNRLKAMFNGHAVFDTPKPVELVSTLMDMAAEDGIVLDFFAGSAATAEAAIRRGNQFIVVQLPEKCPEDSVAKKLGYERISDVALARIKAALEAQEASKYEGVKVLKLDQSCFSEWVSRNTSSVTDIQTQLQLHADNIVGGATQLDLLFEILLKAGFQPTEQIEKTEINGKTIFKVANGALLICLEEQLTSELIDEVIALEPMQFICLDKGFQGNDQLKANTAQAFKARSQNSEAEMVFKVV
ncbi:site-specific DNA-methyltransferase [Pseudoalteromonas sp. JC3]|uniref:site-specific DNA-methyltransferase n=1 Tax=Pseudoalteromonas sp. JC3 TaxID=2810196 RepID=UPI0019CF9292|nr:site-specific DNA-methyltransferase [Pseudoalteromonas sp. JC3]MBR8842326.1 site-specific DNA-methyltransferase [Pseudoalteromonas sp. JC3]WJE09550.1 site-specific DNA-methyltransferase [Pseudoalteromonas sp. JC3]